MHYYPHHIGDYRSGTMHLSNEEDLAYRRLLEMYYDTEQPIPLETQWVARRLRVGTEALESVLGDFFERTEEGFKNAKCDLVIREYREMAEKNRLNGMKGGRPKGSKHAGENPVGSQSDASRNPLERQPITNNQEPVTKNQSLEGTNVPSSPPDGEPAGKKGRKKAEDEFPACSHQSVIDLYHAHCPTLPKVEVWNDVRQGYLRARWREIAADQSKTQEVTTESMLEWWRDFFKFVALSKFLTGRGNYGKDRTPFVADLEWLVRPTNFAKIIENRYHRD